MENIYDEKIEDYLCHCEKQEMDTKQYKSGFSDELELTFENGWQWTKVMVGKCKGCGGLIAFPDTNMKTFLERGNIESKVFLLKIIHEKEFQNQVVKTKKKWWKIR